MQRTLWLLPLLGGMALFFAADANACGDKFLVLGRGVRYQHVHAATHPSSILIYMNPASHISAAAKDIKLESGLKQAGHKVQTVADAAQLEGALKSAKYDLVLADIADSSDLERQIGSQASKPVVLPLLYRPTKEELAAAEKQYQCLMNVPSKDFLAAIDEAMTQKRKGAQSR